MEYIVGYKEGGEGTVRHYVQQLVDGGTWKLAVSVLGSVVSTVEGFYGTLIWGFLGLFALDLISGLLKSKHKGIPITSKRLRQSVTKLGAYMVLISALIISGHYEPVFASVTTTAYYFFMLTELKSIYENAQEMGVRIPKALRELVGKRLDEEDYKDGDGK